MNTMDILNCSFDPWKTLGVPRDADNATIKEAWKSLSQRRIDDKITLAYKMIATEVCRAQWELLSPGRQESLDSILEEIPLRPKYSGPGIWYRSLIEYIKKKDIPDME